MDGFLFVNKPEGMTSHDVVFKLKKRLHVDKIGHTGTLDPFASGLMIVCVGKATKLASLFSQLDKVYEGVIRFGEHYDTYDVTGNVIDRSNPDLDEAKIDFAMSSFIGTSLQLPPMYSAIKLQGQKLYELARKGIEVEREPRSVSIHSFVRTSPYQDHAVSFHAKVSKGTYMRSLAVDLASKLLTHAALKSLHRVSVGDYHVKHSVTPDQATLDDIIPLETFFRDTPRLILNDYMIKLVRNGVYLDQRQTTTETPFIVTDTSGKMIAYYEVAPNQMYHPVLIF